MTLPAVPAVSVVGKPVTVSVLAAAACTAMPYSLAVRLVAAVSVAVIDCVPGRLQRDREGVRARVGGGEGVARPAGRPGVAAGRATVPV